MKIIFFFLNSTAFQMDVEPSTLISDIRDRFPASLDGRGIRLVWGGRPCDEEGRTLSDYNIPDGAAIHVRIPSMAPVALPKVGDDPCYFKYDPTHTPASQIVPSHRETPEAPNARENAGTSAGESQPLLLQTPTYLDRHRIHAFRASGETLLSSGDYMQLRALRGDTLKAEIFGVMEGKLTAEGLLRDEFVNIVRAILHGPADGDDHRAYKILAAGQGIVTRFVQFFSPASMQTDAADTLHALIRHQAEHKYGMSQVDIDAMFAPAVNSAPQMSAWGGADDNDY